MATVVAVAFCLLPCCCCSDHDWLPLALLAPPEIPEDLGEFALDLSVDDESLARLVRLPLLASDARRESLT